jgi:hypothetical protein
MESIHNLLMLDLESISDSGSSRGGYHPSCECFMADGSHPKETPKGHIKSVDGGCVHTMARDMHRRIIKNNDGLPHFTRASQKIALLWPYSKGS